jgi:hypothetical protein
MLNKMPCLTSNNISVVLLSSGVVKHGTLRFKGLLENIRVGASGVMNKQWLNIAQNSTQHFSFPKLDEIYFSGNALR